MQRPSPHGGAGGAAAAERGVFAFDFRDSPSHHHDHHHHNSASFPRSRRHPEPPMSFAPISAQPYGVLEAGRKRPLSYDHHEGHMREAGGGGGGGGYPFHSAPVGMEMGYRYGSQQNPPGRMMPTGMEQGSARTSGMMGAAAGELWEGGGAHAGMMRGGEGGGGGGFRPARVEGEESSPIVHLPPGTKHNAYGEGRAAKMARVGGEEELEGQESETLSFLVGPDGGEEASQLSALVELAAQNLELKNQLREVSRELAMLQNLVNKNNDDAGPDNQWQTRYWSVPEHQRFLEAVRIYGRKNLKAIAVYVGTRSATQVKTHSQKYFQKLQRLARQAKQEDTASSSGADNSNDNSTSNNGEQCEFASLSDAKGGAFTYSSASTASTRQAKGSSNSGSLTSSASPPSS
mmetsp:Transcript_15985/g.37890  ORF Transcript_15985/g.37890 Transcript_15985/m.37890 type:complete len:404 (+) Transcript_15985:338-1549(+)